MSCPTPLWRIAAGTKGGGLDAPDSGSPGISTCTAPSLCTCSTFQCPTNLPRSFLAPSSEWIGSLRCSMDTFTRSPLTKWSAGRLLFARASWAAFTFVAGVDARVPRGFADYPQAVESDSSLLHINPAAHHRLPQAPALPLPLPARPLARALALRAQFRYWVVPGSKWNLVDYCNPMPARFGRFKRTRYPGLGVCGGVGS